MTKHVSQFVYLIVAIHCDPFPSIGFIFYFDCKSMWPVSCLLVKRANHDAPSVFLYCVLLCFFFYHIHDHDIICITYFG